MSVFWWIPNFPWWRPDGELQSIAWVSSSKHLVKIRIWTPVSPAIHPFANSDWVVEAWMGCVFQRSWGKFDFESFLIALKSCVYIAWPEGLWNWLERGPCCKSTSGLWLIVLIFLAGFRELWLYHYGPDLLMYCSWKKNYLYLQREQWEVWLYHWLKEFNQEAVCRVDWFEL